MADNSYWAALLSGCEPDCEPEHDRFEESSDRATLVKELEVDADKLTSVLARAGCDAPAYFTAAFSLLASLFTGMKDVLFATGGDRVFPFHLSLSDTMTVDELLTQTGSQLTDSEKESGKSFLQLTDDFGIRPTLAFGYISEGAQGVKLFEGQAPESSVRLFLEKKSDGSYRVTIDHKTGFYSSEYAASLADTYVMIAGELLSKTQISQIEYVSSDSCDHMDEFNKTEVPRKRENVVAALRRCAKDTADAPAVVAGGKTYTYDQIDRLTDAVAAYLNKQGIGKGSVVSVLIPRNEFMAIASFGVLKSGAAYQPLDPNYPEARLAFMTEDANASFVIADRALRDKLTEWKGPVLFTDEIFGLPEAGPLDIEILPDDLVVLLYTSGTTGKPKGVMVKHSNVSELAEWTQGYFGMKAGCRNLAYASYGFDAHMLDLYPALTCGGCLYIIPDELRLDLGAIIEFINDNKIAFAVMTTQVCRQFALAYEGGSLKDLMAGGEALVPVDPDKLHVRLYNAYGPSECTVLASMQTVDKIYHRVPIGKALENVKLYVVDEHLRRLPVFAPGELLISGPRVVAGYLNLPEKTAACFIDNPFSSEEGYGRAYRTGDVVRMLADGAYDFIGRNDSQVKVRGFRIELSEVESVIREYPGITDATVQAFADENTGMKYLAAYVVSNETVNVDSLNEFIKERKPPYLVPSVTMQLDAIPLTQNQKVDKRALPLPERKEADHEKPANKAEETAFACAVEALGHSDLGVNTDLEYAGLSSIGAMRLTVLLSKAFNRTVRFSEMKALHTVRDIAEFFSSSVQEQAYAIQKSYPLSSVQQGIYVECIAKPGSTAYNLPVLLQLDPSVDLAKLKDAIRAVIDAHPYLHARLGVSANGEVTAIRDDKAEIEIEEIEKKNMRNGFTELIHSFRVTAEPLTRISLIHDEPSSYLFFDIHHLIFDGESLGVFMRDLEDAYNGKTLAKETFTGYEAALDEQYRRLSPAYEEARAYYEKLLQGVDTDCVPVRDRNEAVIETGLLSVDIKVDRGEIEKFLAEGKTTANALWNSAFGLMIAKYLNRADSVYTTVYNGRNDTRLTESVGMFVHTLPVVCNPQPGECGKDFVFRMGRQLGDSMSNDIYSFAEISHNFGVRSDLLFVYEGSIGTSYTVGGKPAKPITLQQQMASKAALTFYVYDTESGFRIECEYETEHYEEWNILSMLGSMEVLMKALVKNEKIDDISLLTKEMKESLNEFNRTEHEVEDTDIVTLFKRRAAEYPDRTAVIFKDKHLTYREVDDLSDRIAAYASGLGLGPEDVVSILIPRNEYMVITVLGVLKSGAAYQPLDPGYPPERLKYMTEDASAKMLIADESLTHLLPDLNAPTLLLKDIGSLPKGAPAEKEYPSDRLFILLYTSGTTGKPKGVMLTHRNLVNFCDWYRRHYDLTQESVVAAYASFGFDADMMDLYPALTTGAAVCIVPEEMRLDLQIMNRYFEDNGVTHSFMTTQIGRMFATQIETTSLKHLSAGGEKLVPLKPPKGFSFTNGYGPTECTIFTTTYLVDKLYDRVPIGSPLSNYKLYVVDGSGHELPAGAMGELWIAGRGVGRGYLNLPEKTEQVFIPNPFCSDPGFDRVFRTGDIVRRLGDGGIDFIGRNDGQVKVRGFRIELAEVEGVIREFEGISDVTVQAFDDETSGGKYIAAYVVSDSEIDFSSLEDFIRSKKPAYMVPAAFKQLDKIPLNQNQKVDKRALPLPERQEVNKEFVEPATPLEREICDEYASILGLEKVGATDSFFDIGGSSISAAQIVMFAMNKGYNIVYKDVFNNPSPRELARAISGFGKEGKAGAAADFDYTKINELIAFNCMDNLNEISAKPVGNVILTGATGFLGIHVLWTFLKKCDGKITCLMRRGKYKTAERRLTEMLMYYFGENMGDLFGKRIFCAEGDITDKESLKALESSDAGTIINCAACVKHFTNDDTLDRINVGGVENLIDLCVRTGKRLVHISTLSIAGEMDNEDTVTLKENMLYFGQNVENDYVRTKFMAERALLNARVKKGLDGVILRAGNLMGRNTDGEFQINFETNAFMRSLWAYIQIGQCPYSMLEQPVEFSPIDSVAEAVVLLAGADKRFSIFHLNNNHCITMDDVVEAIRRHGFKVDAVSEEEFQKTLEEAAKHEEESRTILSLFAYANKEGENLKQVEADNRFTTNAFFRLGFKWPIVDDHYLEKQLWSLDTLAFFDKQQTQ